MKAIIRCAHEVYQGFPLPQTDEEWREIQETFTFCPLCKFCIGAPAWHRWLSKEAVVH